MESSASFYKQVKILKDSPSCKQAFQDTSYQDISEGCFTRVLPVVCNALLQPHLTHTVGSRLHPWLPELLRVLASHPILAANNGPRQVKVTTSGQSATPPDVHPSDAEDSSQLKRKQIEEKNDPEKSIEVSNSLSKKKSSKLREKKVENRDELTRKRAANEERCSETLAGPRPQHCPHYLKMHRSLCVAVAKLLPISPHAVVQFMLEYFEHHPPPYAGCSLSTDELPPLPKKLKLGFEVSLHQTSTEDLLESTYELVLTVERELAELWQWADLITFTEPHHSNLTRWLACQCIGALSCMTEADLETLTLKHVAEEVAHKFSISFALRQQEQQVRLLSKLSPVWKDEKSSEVSPKNEVASLQTETGSAPSAGKEQNIAEESQAALTTLPLQHTNFVGKNLLPLTTAVPQAGSAAPLLLVESTESNVWRAWCGVVACRPVLLEGPVGCGKTATVEHLAALTGRTAAPLLTKVQLGEQTDARSLLGTYRCTATPGEFVWTPGAVTRAVTAGHWLLLEDIDAAQLDVVAIITSLVEDRVLMVPGTGAVAAHRDFRLLATRRLTSDGRRMGGAVGSAGHRLDALWCRVLFSRLTRGEMVRVIDDRYPRLTNISERLVSVYLTLAPDQLCEDSAQAAGAVVDPSLPVAEVNTAIRATNAVSALRASGRLLCFRDLLKWAHRVDANLHLQGAQLAYIAFQEALDCFCAAVPDASTRDTFAEQIAGYLNLSSTVAAQFCHTYKPSVSVAGQFVRVGDRAKLKKLPLPGSALVLGPERKAPFSFTRQSCLLLERVAVAVRNQEPVLIVGETGTGKTTAVQFLAQQTHNKLKVVNMNQQSDATDLLGGFKPVEMKTILFPLREEFEQLFAITMPAKTNFLRHVTATYGKRNWKKLLDLMLGTQKLALEMLDKSIEEITDKLKELRKKMKSNVSNGLEQPAKKKKKVDEAALNKEDRKEKATLQALLQEKQQCHQRWSKLRIRLEQAKGHVEKSQSALAFAFIEGTLTRAIAEGDWVLLDEINLANAETLECLSSLLESEHGSLTLLERGDEAPVVRHTNFRLFACMNPATDVGKKELPPGLRNRFTEFYMEDLTKKEDLEILIADYLIQSNPAPKLVQGIRRLYEEVRRRASTKGELADTTGAAPHYSLRTLCRALAVAARNPARNFDRTLYEAFCLSFLTQLDRNSYPIVEDLILQYLIVPRKSKTLKEPSNLFSKIKQRFSKVLPHPARVEETNDGGDVASVPEGTVIGNYVLVAGYWVSKGVKEPETDEQYILTKSVRWNLRSVVRIVSLGDGSPVLLQGDTSVGKTSLVTYLARKCGVPCIRINNHEHTDIQEYLGSYAPDETGKLIFREGALVTAMRQGHWIILDELNLAPTDVLEALNRLLDDNKELYLPETQETVKAHPNFRLFATQNPPGLYGGRKVLSRAFRNRFVELHFDDIPGDELVDIIHKRCCLSEQHSKKLVSVLQALQMRRGRDNVFQGRQSLVTLRDLFRWAERYHLAQKPEQEEGSVFYEWEQHLADEGYLVLAGRVRNEEENSLIKEVLEEKMRCSINPERLFKLNDETSPVTRPILEKLALVKGFEHMVFTDDMLRLYVLLAKALSFGEPVLLVGETGCGKTTVCQMIAAQQQQELYCVNCHMHTEGADFLGGLRPVRVRSGVEDDRLFEWVDGPLIHAMRKGGMFLADEISLADDSVLERLNSVLEPERTLVLAEKGSSHDASETLKTEVVVAHEAFRLIGTMNPGGDYGKKELSPAMRNRFTEIWCPKIEIQRSTSDVLNIVEHNVRKGLVLSNEMPGKSGIGAAMLEFLKLFTSSELGKRCTVSIRDIISWVQFINKVTAAPGDEALDVGLAYIHGACLVLLDGLGSGLTGTGLSGWEELKDASLNCVYQQVWSLTGQKPDLSTIEESCVTKLKFVDEEKRFGVAPFFIEKGDVNLTKDEQFTFVAPRTCVNLVRVLRGLQLSRPLLLEGSPGVGKTSLVVALAKASNNDIVRINLSEQTDVSDLFGADLPVEGASGGKFAWRDGPLLQALRNGSWVVLDELNLASQSVLEGLNACFDHRGEVFVPELGQSFKVSHKTTKIFACQNPQYQGGARKGLPRSFLNRFTQVHIEPLASGDLEFILLNVYGGKIHKNIIAKMVEMNRRLVDACDKGDWGQVGGPWEMNLRDLFRWCDLILHYGSKMPLRQIVDLLYASRMRTPTDRRAVHAVFSSVFPECAALALPEPLLHITHSSVSIGPARIDRVTTGQQAPRDRRSLCVLQEQLPLLQHMLTCVSLRWLVLLVGCASAGKSALVQQCAALAGARLRTISLSPQMDVGELLGGFEQVDHGRKLGSLLEATRETLTAVVNRLLLLPSAEQSEIQRLLHDMSDLISYRKLQSGRERSSSEETEDFLHQCERLLHILRHAGSCCTQGGLQQQCEHLLQQVERLRDKVQEAGGLASGGIFEWVDSPLVVAIRDGEWVVVEGASLCAASVLDRLNPLLEPGGRLVLAERGVIEGAVPFVRPHPNFRMFLVIDHTCGEVSRAMRNRGVELFVPPLLQGSSFDPCTTAPKAHCSEDASAFDSGLSSTDDGSSCDSDDGVADAVEGVAPERVALDLSTLLACSGLACPRLQNCLVAVHRAACDVLPVYQQPGVSVLLQTARLAVQLRQSGETDVRALALAATEGYVRAHGTVTLQLQVSGAVERVLQKSLQLQQSKSWPALGSLSLQTRTLQQHGAATAVLQQAVNYLHFLVTASNLPDKTVTAWTKAPLPPCEEVPNLYIAAPELLTLVFAGLPLSSWPLLLHGAKTVIKDGKHGLKLIAKMDQVVQALKSGKLCFKVTNSNDCPADTRFVEPSVLSDDASSSDKNACSVSDSCRNSSANRLMLGVWRTLVNSDSPVPATKAATDAPSVLQVSRTINKKKLDKSLAPHACVQDLHPLLSRLSAFTAELCAAPDGSVPLSDSQWLELCTVLRWMDRLEEMLSAPDSLSSFKLLLPKIILHWQFFQDKLFKNLPPEWITNPPSYDKLNKTVQKLTRVFAVNCGPVHEFAAELSLQQLRPNPFPTQMIAEVHTVILRLGERLRPNSNNPSGSAVLVSSVCEKVKMQLVPIVHEFYRGKVNANEMLERLRELEKVLNTAHAAVNKDSSTEPLNAQVSSLKMQSWPVVDLITSQLLAHQFSEIQMKSAKQTSHIQELVTAAPSLPLELLEATNSRSLGWVAAHLHASISNSTASRNSGAWLGRNDSSTRRPHSKTLTSGATQKASKHPITVHSPVQCLLTNTLALTSNKEAVQVLQVGVHSEKAKQLQDIRATLWACWPAIADPALSPKVSFAQHVKKFSQNLFVSLTRVMDPKKCVYTSAGSQEMCKLLTYIRERCATPRVVGLLDEVQKFCGELEKAPEQTDVVSVARLGVAIGTLQGWLAGHLEVMDPTEKRKLLLLYAQKDIKRLEQEILQHSWMNILKGGKQFGSAVTRTEKAGSKSQKAAKALAPKRGSKSHHPHVALLQQTLSEAQTTVATVSQEVAYRPGEEEYVRLTEDLAHFLQAAFNPPDICDIVSRLCDDQVSLMTIEQVDRKLITLENFFSHIHKEFLMFRDVTSQFMEGLSIVVRSLRVLNAQARLRVADSSCGGCFTQVLQRLSSFPVLRNPRDPLDYFGLIDQDVTRLTNYLAVIDENDSIRKRCQSLALRTSLFELHFSVSTAGRMNKDTASLLSGIVSRALLWWRKQEEERKQKEEERASLFKYKAKEHAKNETEEETNAREFKEMFPNHLKDFDDLKEPTLEQNDDALPKVQETDQNEEDEVSDWLREEHLWEITEIHFDLLSNHCPLPVQEPAKQGEAAKNFGVVPAALQRVKLLHCAVSSCGPVASCDLDRSSVGSHLIFNHSACKSLQDPHLATILVKPKNFYVDWRPSEATKLRPLLVPLLKKIDQLLIEWPEHPTLLLIVGVVKRVLQFPVTSPLPKLLSGLEAVLLKAAIWEANAHRGVSLIEYLLPIRTQVVHWRAIELHEWKNCLELVTYNEAFASRMKWWPHLYDSLCGQDWDSGTVQSLSQVLKELMDTATLGDFDAKLKLIGAFHRHLLVTNSPHEDVCNIMGNIYNYYSQFVPAVRAALAKQRSEIEKRVKELVKIANYSIATYKDIDQVRDKVEKSCRGLHVLMNKWKKFLRVNNRDIWAKDAVEELKPTAGEGLWDAKPCTAVTASAQLPPALPTAACPITGAREGSLLLSMNLYCSKSHKFIGEVVESLQYSECIENVEDITASIIESYLKLSADLSLTANETDKDARLNKMKTVMKQRRVSVTRLFKQLGDIGVRYHRGNTLWTDEFFNKSLHKSTVDTSVLHLNEATRKEFLPLWQGCEKYYYRSMNRMQLLLERLTVPHQDLGPDLIKRVRGACKHLMLMSADLKEQSTLLAHNLSLLTCFLDDLKQAPQHPVASVSTLVSVCDKIHSFSLSLSLSAAEVCAVIDTRPETEGLLAGDELRKSPSQMQLVEAHALLTGISSKCKDVAQKSSHVIALCTTDSWPRIVNNSHVQAISSMNSELCDVAKTLTRAVVLMDSEKWGHVCLTRQLIAWMNGWAQATKEVESWLLCPDQRLLSDELEEDASSIPELENCTSTLLYAVQCLYKKYHVTPTTDEAADTDLISNTMVASLMEDMKSLKLNYILKCLTNLVGQVTGSCSLEAHNNLLQIQPLLSQYACLCDNLLLSAAATGRSVSKLFSVLLAIFYQMANKGFCKPQDLQEEGGTEGKLSFEDDEDSEAAGLAEGEGKKDMSDKLESEDQLESALQEGQKENPGDKDLKEENGVEMSEDFEAKLQDMERPEMDEEDENEKEDENKMDDQMGETEHGAETLDKKLWNEKEDQEEGEEGEGQQDLEEDDSAEAGDDERESQIVAKEKHQKKKKKDDKDKDKKGKEDETQKNDEPEELEEDHREPKQSAEGDDDDEDDGNFEDHLAGENRQQDQPEDDGKDIPDDLNLDEAEEEKPDEEDANNDDEEHPKEMEKKALFPEGKDLNEEKEDDQEEEKDNEDLPEEENHENDANEDKNLDEMENTDKDFQADEVDDDKEDDDSPEKEHKKNAGKFPEEEESQEDKQEEKQDEVEASKDRDTKNNAEAAPVDAKDASKDQTKEAPKTDDSGQDREDAEEQQEETGETGERTQESLGVGQSDAQPQDQEMHQGEQSNVTRDSKQSNDHEDQQQEDEKPKKNRKPGDVDERKVTGDPEKKLRQGLMTSEKQDVHQEDEPDKDTPDNCDNEDGEQEDDSPVMRTIKKAEEESEGQAVDAGTHDQAIEAPAPLQEDDAPQPEEEGVQQHLMDVDDKEEDEDSPTPEKLEAEKQKGRGREHRQGQEADGETDAAQRDEEKMETEGEFVLEHTVQRPPETYFHTLLEQEELTAEAQLEDDMSATSARLQESRLSLQRADDEACHSWAAHQAQVAPYAAQLSDQLRLILEPTEASRLKGDYKTGKRLNMRKVIGYIASHFLKDKIWLRRTQPSKRTYHVLLAVDDSESMKAVRAEELAKQSISLVSQALTKLEVGKVGVVSFGSSTTLLHSLDDAFSDASGAKIFANLKFEQQESRFVDLLESSVALFRDARGGAVAHSDTAQILLIISDGQTHARSEALRAAVRAARNDRVFVVFFVLDASEDHSFYDIKVWDNTNLTLKPLAEEFPFPFYLVVRDLTTLPHVLAEALRRWFELVTADVTH